MSTQTSILAAFCPFSILIIILREIIVMILHTYVSIYLTQESRS